MYKNIDLQFETTHVTKWYIGIIVDGDNVISSSSLQ